LESETFYLNGIDARTGDYARPPMDLDEVVRGALGRVVPADQLQELMDKWSRQGETSYALADDDLDPSNLADAGWGVVFPYGVDPAIRKALAPLLALRERQANAGHGNRFRVYEGPTGYRPGESAIDFLGRQGVGPGPVDPMLAPMYLMLVGGPEEIPFEFQYQLDVQYAVGRVHFERAEDYAQYASAVVAAETSPPPRPRRVVLAGTHHPDDPATEQSATLLVAPLAESLAKAHPDWAFETLPPESCTRSEILGRFAPAKLPGLLFTATHGMQFPLGDPLQASDQGALLCQDWPGRTAWGRRPISPDHYLAGRDLPEGGYDGLVAFLFACFGAGTPRLDDYPNPKLNGAATIANQSFVAALPRHLLRKGAAAVIGHVDRAWPCSFVWRNAGPQLQAFRSTFQRLLRGQPVGWACDKLNLRYAELASYLNPALQDIRFGKKPDADFGYLWTASNDARAYVILGDPAARLIVPPVAPA